MLCRLIRLGTVTITIPTQGIGKHRLSILADGASLRFALSQDDRNESEVYQK